MLQISPSAATFISLACSAHELGEGSGVRISPNPDRQDRHKLRLRYVPGPEPGDVVVDNGDARVFVADEIAPTIARLVLDTTDVDGNAGIRLVMRKGR